MKEPKNKKFVLFALVGSIVMVIIALSSVAYLVGRDVSNEDTSAAVEEGDDEPINLLASIYDVYEQEFGDITMRTQRYASVGDLVNFNFHYDPSANLSQARPTWEVELCGDKYTGESSASFFQEVIMPRGTCEVKVVIYKGTASEQGFTMNYNPVMSKQRVAMRAFNYPKTVDQYRKITISTDLTAQIANLGLNVDGVNWTILTADKCVPYPEYQYGKPDYKMVRFSILGLETGNCRIKMQASAFTCSDCAEAERKVYNFTRAFTVRVKQGGEVVDPTASLTPTYDPELSPTPSLTLDFYPSITPTPVITNTPVVTPVYVSTSAVKLVPTTANISANSKRTVSIMASPPTIGIEAMQIRLNVTGGTIVADSYTSTNGTILSVGTCGADGSKTTSRKVCVDVAKISGAFSVDESIGTFKVLAGTSGPITIRTDTGHGYLVDGELVYSQTQQLAKYTVTP